MFKSQISQQNYKIEFLINNNKIKKFSQKNHRKIQVLCIKLDIIFKTKKPMKQKIINE